MPIDFLTTGEAARRLGIPRHRLLYAFEVEKVPEPPRMNGRRVIPKDDLKGIAVALGLELREECAADGR